MSADVNSGLSDTVSSFFTKPDFLDSVSGTSFVITFAEPPAALAFSNEVVLIVEHFFLAWIEQ